MNNWQVHAGNEAEMEQLGARLAQSLDHGGVVYLQGELGAGKTTLTRGLLQALGHAGNVKSPTYTLVEPYELAGRQVYHFDLYRLMDPEELELLGIRDYFAAGNLLLIEWPSKGAPILPQPDMAINITVLPAGRSLDFVALTAKGRSTLARLAS